jgi:hypothetical protein
VVLSFPRGRALRSPYGRPFRGGLSLGMKRCCSNSFARENPMDTIRISSTMRLPINELRLALAQHWRIEDVDQQGLVVHGESSRVYLHHEGTSGSQGEDLLLDYTDVELVKQVIETIADDPQLVVDDDFGTVLPGDKFVARIKGDRSWNWRNPGRAT